MTPTADMKKKPAKPVARVTYAHCSILASVPLPCFLCKVLVPAFTQHYCERKRPT